MKAYTEQYKFSKTSLEDSREYETIEMTFESFQLDEVLDHFERFLKGSGFVFEGTLAIVNDDGSVQ